MLLYYLEPGNLHFRSTRMAEPEDRKSDDLTTPFLPPASAATCDKVIEMMSVDEMLQRYAGEFGPWQYRHFALTSLAWALNAFHTMVVVFADREPLWRCTHTATAPCTPTAICSLRQDEWEWAGGRSSSTIAEWGLICDRKYMVSLPQSAFFAGALVGAGVFGHLSDSRLGRKGTLTTACCMNAAFGLLTAFSPSFHLYALLRFVTGISTGGVGLSAFVLCTEPIGTNKRGVAGMSTFYFFSIGTAILSAVSYFIPSWRALYAASSLPSFLFVLAIIPFISESPRWYLVHNNISRAMDVMRSIAKSNKRHLPDNVSLVLDSEREDGDHQPASKGSLLDVVKSPVTCSRLALAVAINLLTSVVYYGLNLNVGNLGTELHVSVVLNAIVEVPAYALTAAASRWFGRRPLTAGTFWLSGAFCMVGSLLGGAGVWRMACGVVGIFAVTATFDLLYIYAAELFPTAVRNAALGCVSQAAQVGAVVVPPLVQLGGRWPFGVFGACGVVGGVLALYLPETLDKPLYDTMAALESGEIDKRG